MVVATVRDLAGWLGVATTSRLLAARSPSLARAASSSSCSSACLGSAHYTNWSLPVYWPVRARFDVAASAQQHPPEACDRFLVDTHDSSRPPLNPGSDQHLHFDSQLHERLRNVLRYFRAPIRYAFAYGSGVFGQGASKDRLMIDFIFGVSHTQHWHSLNMQEHPEHYSFLRHLGSRAVSLVQDNVGAGVYFNPYVEIDGMMIKYGVTNVETLYDDLTNWNTLYLAGRMQKPIKTLIDEPKVSLANQSNLIAATRTALLMLPEQFDEYSLYTSIAGLSYIGDLRMSLPTENPKKVDNIVRNNMSSFRHLYFPIIETLPNIRFINSKDEVLKDLNAKLEQDYDPARRANMVRRLPKSFRSRLYKRYRDKYSLTPPNLTASESTFGGEFEKCIAADIGRFQDEIGNTVRQTIAWTSFTQTSKGIVTAGPIRSIRYLAAKAAKWWHGYKSA